MPTRRETFPRTARLLRPPQFTAAFARGERFVCAGFVIVAVANNEGYARLGMALAKRRLRLAVERNRVRRTVRESFRRKRHELPAVDIVVLARRRTGAMDSGDLRRQLAKIWRRVATDACLRTASTQETPA